MHRQVLDFWFDEIEPALWFKKDDDFDRLLHTRFNEIWHAAAAGELAHWRETIEGRLAEVIVLDQFSRNLFRGTPRSFASDCMALVLYTELDNGDQLAFELRHKAIIDRFGRYPHRNAILGRVSTPEEEAFLLLPGSGF